ncbi:MAG: oligosaccharide flippase family protein [Clostridium sp.]|uniref:lipopolysaccharide biosynthesis protein n=1 Tax=Clostridium sp. TaxID=1506 RepID=UPI003027B14E
MSSRRLLRNSGIYAIVQILQKSIGLILIPVYTSLMDPSTKGISDTVLALVSVLGIFFSLSISAAVIRFYVDYKEDKNKLNEFWGTCITFVALNSIIMGGIFILFKRVLIEPFATNIEFYPYILLGMISTILNPVFTIFQTTLQAKEESRRYAGNNLAYFIVNISLNILFVVGFRLGSLGILLALAITEIIFFIYTLIKFIPTITITIKKTYLVQALKYSLPLLPHSLSGWAVSMIDRLFLSNLTGVASSAIYSIGSQFPNIINVLTQAVNQAYVPWFFERMKNKAENEAEIVKMSEILAIVYGVLAMGMSLFGPEIFKIMVNEAYFSGWTVIPFLSFAFVFNGIYYFFVNPLFFNKKGVKFIAIGTFTGAILNSILNVILVPKFNIIGASVASMLSSMVSCILIYYIAKKIEPINFSIIRLFCITFIFLLIGMSSFLLTSLSFWMSILVKILIVLFVFMVLCIIYKKEIINLLKKVKTKKSI